MKTAITIVTLAVLGASIATPVWADATTSPGVNSVHVSSNHLSMPDPFVETVLLTGTILRGKRNRVLVVDATFGSLAPGENAHIKPLVNGVGLEPTDDFGNGSGVAINCPSTATLTCTASGSWWLDLDAAEAAQPGKFIGRPLTIELRGGTNQFAGVPGPIVAILNARREKK